MVKTNQCSWHNAMKNKILAQFNIKFQNPQIYVKSPGRANIIGEHTDYNHGLVLPFAIEQCIHMYIGQNSMGLLRIYAYDIDESTEIHLSKLSFQNSGWTRYFVNALVASRFDQSSGIDVVFGGDLPQGGGVSSSSALTCGFLAGLNTLFNLEFTSDGLIDLASQAENGIGLNGGIMDQTAILKGKHGCALKIDFLDYSIKEFEMPNDEYSFYLFNSGQKHDLVETEYNKRRTTCENALKTIQKFRPNVETLRDISKNDIENHLVDDISKNRCIHVLDENERVRSATKLLQEKKYDALGPLLIESHSSLSNYYEVSTPEIDYLIERSQKISNLLGCRIMGGGFGGCTINFVKGKLTEQDLHKLILDYKEKCSYDLLVHKISASDGVQVSWL